jgi:class 3 adenylate cyclase/tetratricopeptide (TPR) repeat protein
MMDVSEWLTSNGFENLVELFSENDIDGEVLPDLSDADLQSLGLTLGVRKKLLKAISAEGAGSAVAPASVAAPADRPAERSPDAERRQLTIMFVDLVGSTELSGKLDPEELRTLIADYQNAVAGVVTRFEGHVAKYMGDGVLCYFGWPRAHEDDAERAVHAGLAVNSEVSRLRAPDGAIMSARTGIATGLVIVGDLIGEGAAQEEAVVGETPNLAARLQGLAGPGEVFLSSSTRRLLGDLFEIRDAGLHELKGIAGQTQALKVIGERQIESRFEARSGATLSELVGREHELGLMLERWKQASAGEGQLVLLTGEAGIGKSRITRGLVDSISSQDHIRINYQCSPYHADSSLYPAIQQLTFASGIRPDDSNEIKLDKLEAQLAGADTALLAALMGLDGKSRYGEIKLTPQQQRTRTLDALINELVAQSRRNPVLCIIEDAHWIDATMLELLDLCLDRIADARILLLITARPTFEHGFGGHPAVTRLSLNRLGRQQVAEIAMKVTAGRNLPDELLDEIARKTDGIPLFVEELTRTVIESGELRETPTSYQLTGPLSRLAIPTTLHDSLMARLDRLQPIKEVAQAASCIGREFSYSTISRISMLGDDELVRALDQLTQAEIIFRRGIVPDATFVFKHALVRDAAYESLLKARRQALHRKIVDALADENVTAPELLAYHCMQADLRERAVELWAEAGARAAALPAYQEAVNHLRSALQSIAGLADRESWRERELEILVQLAQIYIARFGYGSLEATEAFERAASLIDTTENMELRMATYYGMWIGPYIRGQHQICLPLAERFAAEFDQRDLPVPRLIAHRMNAATLIAMGQPAAALRHIDVSLQLYEDNNTPDFASRFAQEPGLQVKCYQLLGLWMAGRESQALHVARDALEISRGLGHANTFCYVGLHTQTLGLLCRDYTWTRDLAKQGLSVSREHEMRFWTTIFEIAAAIAGVDRPAEDRLAALDEALASYIADGNRLWVNMYQSERAQIELAMERPDDALQTIRQARENADAASERWVKAEILRVEGLAHLARSNREKAEETFVSAVSIASQQGAGLLQLRAATELARMRIADGKPGAAAEILRPLIDGLAGEAESRDVTEAVEVLRQAGI